MDPRHLELLRELADRGSVTAVAQATHRTPSAVSQQLRTAQRQLGARLVEPDGRGLRLTEAGRVLAEGGRDVARTIAEVRARWDSYRGTATGTVTVTGLPSALTFLLPPVLAELEGSGIELVCSDADLAEVEYAPLVRDHDVVVAHSLTDPPAGTDGLVTVHLAREPLDLVMRSGHPLASREAVTAEEAADWPWYGVPLGYPFDTVRLAVEEATGRPVEVVQRLRDNRLVEALVASGDRVAVLPRFTSPAGRDVVLRPLAGLATARHVFAVLRPDKAERLAVRRVVEALSAAGRAATAGTVAVDAPGVTGA